MSLQILALVAITLAAWLATFRLTVDRPLDAMALVLPMVFEGLIKAPLTAAPVRLVAIADARGSSSPKSRRSVEPV